MHYWHGIFSKLFSKCTIRYKNRWGVHVNKYVQYSCKLTLLPSCSNSDMTNHSLVFGNTLSLMEPKVPFLFLISFLQCHNLSTCLPTHIIHIVIHPSAFHHLCTGLSSPLHFHLNLFIKIHFYASTSKTSLYTLFQYLATALGMCRW